jgi:CubicO group peptidase (beta-lactamase class C family)
MNSISRDSSENSLRDDALLPVDNEMISKLIVTVALIGTIVATLTITPIYGSESPQPFKLTDEIKNRINAIVDTNKTNAAIVIGIIDPNGTQFYSIGKLSEANNSNVNENTIFAIGSITKVFTTTLLADAVQEGLIKLDDPVDKYLPSNVTAPQYNGHKITIEDLATHRSGLPEVPPNYCPAFAEANLQTPDEKVQWTRDLTDCSKNYTFDQFYQGLSNTTISREPGSKYEYSNFGVSLLGNILTLKSNMSSYDELVTKKILNVLGMNSTSLNLSDEQKSRLATGHTSGRELPLINLSNPEIPAGSLYSSAGDMLKFISANIGLIKTKLDSAMQESHLIRATEYIGNNTNNEIYTGLGWHITTNLGNEIIWTNGDTFGGYNAYIAFNPSTERGIIILCSATVSDADITTFGFNQISKYSKLSSLIWNLLSQ